MANETATFRRVPFDPAWTIAGTKYDLKAIYRRPQRTTDEFDRVVPAVNAQGIPMWDLTGPLPLRRHADWVAKGYEYVTLADMESLEKAAPGLRKRGLNPQEFIQHPQLGPWNPKMYLKVAHEADSAAYAELAALVAQFGAEAVIQIRRAVDPNFDLPQTLQPKPPAETADVSTADGPAVAAEVADPNPTIDSALEGGSAESFRAAAVKPAKQAKAQRPNGKKAEASA